MREMMQAKVHSRGCEVDGGLCANQLLSRLVAGSFVADDKTKDQSRAQVMANYDVKTLDLWCDN